MRWLALAALLASPHHAIAQDGPDESVVTQRGTSEMLASGLGAVSVIGPSGETIGDVEEAILSHDGRIVALVVGVGGFLGLAEKPVGVRYERFEVRETDDGIEFVVDLDRAALEAAPRFEKRDD